MSDKIDPKAMVGFYAVLTVIAWGAAVASLFMIIATISGSPEHVHHHLVWVSHWRAWEWLPLAIGAPCGLLATIGLIREADRR